MVLTGWSSHQCCIKSAIDLVHDPYRHELFVEARFYPTSSCGDIFGTLCMRGSYHQNLDGRHVMGRGRLSQQLRLELHHVGNLRVPDRDDSC